MKPAPTVSRPMKQEDNEYGTDDPDSEALLDVCSRRPFFVLKDENGKYFVEANSLIRYINTCPDFNPYEIPGIYEPDNKDNDAPMDESVFQLTEDMLPQVCGVTVDEECAPLIAYRRGEVSYQERVVTEIEKLMQSEIDKINF